MNDGKHIQRLREAIIPVHESTVYPPKPYRASTADLRDLVALINDYDYLRLYVESLELALTRGNNDDHS